MMLEIKIVVFTRGKWDSSQSDISVLSGGDENILYLVLGDGLHRCIQFQNSN